MSKQDDRRVSVAGVFRDVTGKPFNGDRAAVRLLNRMFAEGDCLTVSLPLVRLNATQPDVGGDFAGVPGRYGADEPDALPAVVKYRGSYYITDGHHRLMAEAADGATSSAVRLFDLDGDTQTDFPLLDLMEGSPSARLRDDMADPEVRLWGHDRCHVLTLALHHLTGWPILTLHDRRCGGGNLRLHEDGAVLHSGVLAPDGRFLDVRGLHAPEDMERLAELYGDAPWVSWGCDEPPTEADLLEIVPEADLPSFGVLLDEAEALIASCLAPMLAGRGIALTDEEGADIDGRRQYVADCKTRGM
jgi:hypothetical protein